ncbi:CotH kinase family protein [Nocardioides ferulae]|uniref:CotH kinase family protein n=1 Tax=Nocardioides ferulae TaxID=2340821 RepID=UPI000EABF917|nr:CotH kinase family protein [Nocardioides ferulae]
MTTRPPHHQRRHPHRHPRRVAALAAAAVLALGACSTGSSGGSTSTGDVTTAARQVGDGTGVWDAGTVHDLAVDVDDDVVAAMIDTYQESGEKEWIEATVTLDGSTFERAGLRLKGNSSLRGVEEDADPADLPWLVRLDEFVDGQQLDGSTDFVVRSNTTETALNEAVALDLLAEAGLASEHAVATSFSVNGGTPRLRLLVQALDEAWEAENFSSAGLLYKSEAEGDWSWRGDDPEAYTDVFDQETGEDDLEPLIDFLDFLNNSSDETFRDDLPQRLDVAAFARYLAFEEVIDNFDDIDGPGNNSYLRYDAETGGFTVVAWDHNLAFGAGPGGGAGMGGPPSGELPEGMPEPPEGMPEPGSRGEHPGAGGFGGRTNVLVERFTAVEEWADLVEEAKSDLVERLYAGGIADDVIDRWVDLLTSQADDLVDPGTVNEEAEGIREVVADAVTAAADTP